MEEFLIWQPFQNSERPCKPFQNKSSTRPKYNQVLPLNYWSTYQLTTYPYLLSTNLYPAFCICCRRKRSPNCRWQNPKLFDQFEYYPGCQNKTFGDPRYVRLHSGACNNLHPGRQHWGLIGIPFSRLLPADYSGE